MEGKDIKWKIGDKSSASPKVAAGKSAERTSGFVDNNITDTSEKSSPADEKSANSGGIQHSLKRKHRQVNPIREDGETREEYQSRIDREYTVRSNAEINRDAERMIERRMRKDHTICP